MKICDVTARKGRGSKHWTIMLHVEMDAGSEQGVLDALKLRRRGFDGHSRDEIFRVMLRNLPHEKRVELLTDALKESMA